AVTSTNALVMAGVSPHIIEQPMSGSSIMGLEFGVGVVAGGTEPLFYQWSKNGTNINGATSSVISFNAGESANSGTYGVVVSNEFGSISSSNAAWTVRFGSIPVGYYSSLFYEETEVKHETSGYFVFQLTRAGRFSGTIKVAGGSYPIKNGLFRPDQFA